MHCYAL
jgi:hypothetical protein